MMPASFGRVVVVGLGLMGASVCKALRRAQATTHLCGIDRMDIAASALLDRIVDEARTIDDADHQLASADLVILCVPVLTILHILEHKQSALKQGPVVTDIGSTKVEILRRAERLGLSRFVGGHPMTGRSIGGQANARADLFDASTWFLSHNDDVDTEALAVCQRLVEWLGAVPVDIDAHEHDRAVAVTSHLPHLLSNILAELVLDHGALEATGGSLREILRVAGAPHEIWQDTLSTNGLRAAEGLRDFAARALDLADALVAPELDHQRLSDLFARGRACRDHLERAAQEREATLGPPPGDDEADAASQTPKP